MAAPTLAALAVALLLAHSLHAQDSAAAFTPRWVAIDSAGVGAGEFVLSADRETIRRKDGFVTMWISFDYDSLQRTPNGNDYRRMLERLTIDCAGQSYEILDLLYYDFAGDDVESHHLHGESTGIAPGSVLEPVARIVCSPKNSPPR